MALRLAVIGDLHLPDLPGTAQYACLDWAMQHLRGHRPDAVMVIGDITASGSPAPARHFMVQLGALDLPYQVVLGNADLRTAAHQPAVGRILRTDGLLRLANRALVAVNTEGAAISTRERERLTGLAADPAYRDLALFSHYDLPHLDPDSRRWLEAWLAAGRASLMVVGHSHRDGVYRLGKAEVHSLRGLDPDKAIGGPPAIAYFEWRDTRWARRDEPFPAGSPVDWSAREREEFLRLLGLTCYDLEGLSHALTRNVKCVELHHGVIHCPPDQLRASVRAWRQAGGEYLSLHLPDLSWDRGPGAVRGLQAWEALLRLAAALEVQAVTVHPPNAPLALMAHGSQVWETFLEVMDRALSPGSFRVCVENMHMGHDDEDSPERRFGCLPEECVGWVSALEARLGPDRVGFLLDVGHATNNAPYSEVHTLGTWYARMGPMISGYHLHQVTSENGRKRNHQPIAGLYGPLVSFSSLLWAWRVGQVSRRPMFLEIRDLRESVRSLEGMRTWVGGPAEEGS